MRYFLLIFVLLHFSTLSFAKKGDVATEALYIVPSEPDLINYSRFMVEIVEPFIGSQTSKLSYVFPEILTGEIDKIIEFKRIPNTENSWISDELTAHCTTTNDFFSCNIYVKKDQLSHFQWMDLLIPKALAQNGTICTGLALAHVKNMGLSQNDVIAYSRVINNFCSSEPAGTLIYEFK